MTEQRQGEAAQSSAAHAARARHPERPCLNCGDPTYGEYCPRCGQHKVDVQVSVGAMVKDLLEDELLLGRRLPHTLLALLFRPGFLTVEVLKGRIVRYVRPFKLYLASSVVFFLVLSFISVRALEVDGSDDGEGFRVEMGDSANMGLAQLDSAIADLDTRIEGPDLSAGTALALSATRAALASERERLLAQGDSGATPPVGEAREASGSIQLPEIRTGIARVDSVLGARTRRLEAMEAGDALREVVRTFMAYVPTLMFVLLPVFAAVLKLLYIRQARYYAEHMIFVLHTHAFIFAIFTLMILTRDWIGGWPLALLLLWVFVYIFLAMQRVYGQSRAKTLVKYWTLGWMYFWILLVGIPVLFLVSIFLVPA